MSEIHVPTCPQCGAVMEIVASCHHGLMPKLKLPPCPNCAAKDAELFKLRSHVETSTVRALKARAEKAERERDEWERAAHKMQENLVAAEARIAAATEALTRVMRTAGDADHMRRIAAAALEGKP